MNIHCNCKISCGRNSKKYENKGINSKHFAFSFLYIATNGGGVWSVIKGQNWPTTRTEWKTHDTRYQISGRRFTINFITNFNGNGRIGGCWQTCFPAFFSRIPLRQFAVFSSSILRLLQIMYTLWKFSAIFYSIEFSPHPSQEE